jgi:acetyltransferase-like isoleucine patch superfamily enzyme
MRNLIKKIVKRIIYGHQLVHKYTIGNIKHHNTKIDTLTPNLVFIGDYFVSAPGSRILTHDASLFMKYNIYKVGKVIIGDNVFLGANAIVMPGVTIGDNVIIGAGSVVTKNIESGFVVAGVPAKIITTVDKYYEKVKNSNKDITPPKSFDKVRDNGGLTHKDIYDFRSITDERLH